MYLLSYIFLFLHFFYHQKFPFLSSMKKILDVTTTFNNHYDILVMGADDVGKSSLIYRYVNGTFHEDDHEAENLFVKVVEKLAFSLRNAAGSVASSGNSTTQEISILDTSSFVDTYATSRKQQAKNTLTMLFTYAIDSRDSFEYLEYLMHTIQTFTEELPPCVVAGLKLDNFGEAQVSVHDGQELATTFGALHFQEVSALNNLNVAEVFDPLVEAALEVRAARKTGAAKSELTSQPDLLSDIPSPPEKIKEAIHVMRRPSAIPQPPASAHKTIPTATSTPDKASSRERSNSYASEASVTSHKPSRTYQKQSVKVEKSTCCIIM